MAIERLRQCAVRIVGLGLIAALSGCSSAPGRIFTIWTTPLTTNFQAAPVGSKSCEIDEHHIEEPFTRANVSVDWTSEEIRRAMQEAGMTRAFYADRRVISFFGGIYRRTTIVIHGD